MKVYFDVSSLNPDKITGIGVYIQQLYSHMQNQADLEIVPVIKPSRLKRKKKIEKFLNARIVPLWPWTGLLEKKALYHGPDFKILAGKHLKRVVTVHDMVVFEKNYNKPEFYQTGIKELSKVLNSNPDGIIVNSGFTKKEVLKYFPQLEKKIFVTYLGCDPRSSTQTFTPAPKKDFILFLGTLEKRKNVVGVIEGFEILCSQGRPENLVLAGTWGYGAEEIKKKIEESPFKERIRYLEYVSNDKVVELFKTAKVFIFPSWYEGFGLPVIEAMSLGCPVVTSSGGVLEEISQDAALLAPPDQPQAIAKAIETLLTDEALRQEMIRRGLQQAAKFSWKKCAQETIDVYKNTI